MNKAMTEVEEEKFIKDAYESLINRGVIKYEDIEPSPVTDADLDEFEKEFNIKIPSLYRTFLKTYCCDFDNGQINGVVPLDIDEETIEDEETELRTLWIELVTVTNGKNPLQNLYNSMNGFREVVTDEDLIGMTSESCSHLLPIGDWGAGWGPLCFDLTCPEESVDFKDTDTWSLVWFDHEEFDWDELYLQDDGLVHGDKIIPDFKTLIEWYFFGKLIPKYEEQEKED